MSTPYDADLVADLLAFEDEQLDHEEVIWLFQRLVDTGMAWKLQGYYGRIARSLIDAGLVEVRP